MNILYPIGSFYPSQSGGPNNTIYWITKEIQKRGLSPIIVTTNDGIKEKHNIKFNSWLETDYGNSIYVRTIIHYFPFSAFLRTVRKIPHSDVIHLTAIFYPLSWMIAIVNAIFFKKRIVWSPRGELDPQALIYSTWKKKPILYLINTFLKSKVVFHVTCDAEARYVKNNFNDDTSIIKIPNYIELPNLIETQKRNYLVYLGRIHPKKAIKNLITAIGMSHKFMEMNMKLKIAGDYNNNYGRKLIEYVKELKLEDSVDFLGHIEGNRKERLLAEAYFLIMPSHTENFGNVVVEALAQKTPVVASKGTPWRILEETGAGFWIDNSPNSITEKINYILKLSPVDYNDKANNALKLAQNEFNVESQIFHWIRFYKNETHGK